MQGEEVEAVKLVILSAIISSAISALILNCGEDIASWISDKLDDFRKWIREKSSKN